jgi:WD40 repeat protein
VKYRAFITYSRKDTRTAKRLHRTLEQYRVPKGVSGADERGRLGRFFLDDDELRASEHLGAALDGAIDESKDLIVVASPDAAQSVWVNKEIARFKRRGTARVFVIIARGRPLSDDAAVECFPPRLKYRSLPDGTITSDLADPPLAADLTAEGFSRVFIRTVAGLLDVSFDSLWQREKRRAIRRRAVITASAALVLTVSVLAMAQAVVENDLASLRDRSIAISSEQWRFYREPDAFGPAFRAGLAASRLDRPGVEERWGLSAPSESTSRALALTGQVLPSYRVYGDFPDLLQRDNFRDDIPEADPAQRVAIHAGVRVSNMCFSGNSKRLGLVASNGQVCVYDVLCGNKEYTDALTGVGQGARMALDETGQHALLGMASSLYFIDVEAATFRVCSLPEFIGFHGIQQLHGKWLVCGSLASGAVVIEFNPLQCRITNRVNIPAFTPYNSSAFAATGVMFVGYEDWSGLTPVQWDFRTRDPIKFDSLGFGVGQVKVIAVDNAGELVALGGNGSGGGALAGVQLVSLRTGTESARLLGHTGEVYSAHFLPTGSMAVTGGSDFSIRLWDVHSGSELLRLAGHLGDIYDERISPDGQFLATSSSDGMVLLHDISALYRLADRPLWEVVSDRPEEPWQRPSTVLSAVERASTRAYQGRPWDVLEWNAPWSPSGVVQSVRAMLVRRLGWSMFDYAPPAEVQFASR